MDMSSDGWERNWGSGDHMTCPNGNGWGCGLDSDPGRPGDGIAFVASAEIMFFAIDGGGDGVGYGYDDPNESQCYLEMRMLD